MHANSKEDSFWRHEWEKHGTCAAQLPQMDSELKYFEEGVALNAKFPLQKYLSDASITPGTFAHWGHAHMNVLYSSSLVSFKSKLILFLSHAFTFFVEVK